jgi:cation diffusion facilitator family transporter
VHAHDLKPFVHGHDFRDRGAAARQRALVQVTVLTLATMVAELVAGWWTGSLALTADGWHMGTHALALGGAVLAYRLSARAAARVGYAFGGWKIEVLAAYTSALALLGVALWLGAESVQALRTPRVVAYGEAALVAAIGLAVNVASAWMLARGARTPAGQAHARDDRAEHAHHADLSHRDHAHTGHAHTGHGHEGHAHGRGHGGHPGHPHGAHASHHHHDHNFGAAYLHVLADALTSVLALVALAGGAWWGLRWLDPAVALVGAIVVGQWSIGMLRASARALVDATEDPAIAESIRRAIESDGDAKVADLHAWQVGTQAWCATVSVVADRPRDALVYRERLRSVGALRHVTVEVHRCTGDAAGASRA